MATSLLVAPRTTIIQYIGGTPRKEPCPLVTSLRVCLALSSFSFPCSSSQLWNQSCPLLSSHVSDHGRQSASCYVVTCLPSSSSPTTSSTSTRLYISGLSFRTTEESFRTAFEKFGQLVEVNLVMDKIANRPRGFAFLRYATEEESKKAIEGMHGKFLDSRVIFVEVAKPRSEVRKNKQY